MSKATCAATLVSGWMKLEDLEGKRSLIIVTRVSQDGAVDGFYIAMVPQLHVPLTKALLQSP